MAVLTNREMIELGHQIGNALWRLNPLTLVQRHQAIKTIIRVSYRHLIKKGFSPDEIISLEMGIIEGVSNEISHDRLHHKLFPSKPPPG